MSFIKEIVKGGYLVEVTSTENDGDYTKTAVIGGLSKKLALFIQEYCLRFKSDGRTRDKYHLGNTEMFESLDEGIVEEVAANHNVTAEEYNQYLDDVEYELIGYWAEGEYWRVVESVKVYEVDSVTVHQIEEE